jgi:outer membrane murein-binding lipoprotein Lpp
MAEQTGARPRFSPQISLGNVIQIGLLVVGMAVGWTQLQSAVDGNTRAIDGLGQVVEARRLRADAMEARVRALENEAARADERFSNILTMLARIDSKLERIERGRE